MKCCDMKCGCDCRCNQKRIVVELLKEELYGDIESAAYIYADSLPVDEKEGGHEKHNIYDIIQEGNIQTTARLLDQAIEDCKETLFALTKHKLHGSEFDTNEWRIMTGSPVNDQDAYYLAMIVPDDIPDGTAHTLMTYAHKYIVNKVLEQYLIIVHPDGAERFAALALDAEERMERAVQKSTGNVHIVGHYFD